MPLTIGLEFIPALAEVKFPLQQIVRSQIFSWNEEADLAWQRLKALIALDVRLTSSVRKLKECRRAPEGSSLSCTCPGATQDAQLS